MSEATMANPMVLAGHIEATFPDQPPDTVCVPCLIKSFVKGFVEGFLPAFVIGVAVGAAIAFLGITIPVWATVGLVALGVVALGAAVVSLANKWNQMSPNQRAEGVGQLIGGVLGGAAGGAVGGKVGSAAREAWLPPEEPVPIGPGEEPPLSEEPSPEPPAEKPYSDPTKRPSYGKGQVEEVWENAQQPDGKVYDPNTGEELQWDPDRSRAGQWDMGHVPGKEYRNLHQDYMDGKIDSDEFLNEYRNPDNYRPESPSANRSHRFEQK